MGARTPVPLPRRDGTGPHGRPRGWPPIPAMWNPPVPVSTVHIQPPEARRDRNHPLDGQGDIYVMNCLECSMSPAMDVPNAAIGDCAYCGAGVCLDHARVVTLQSSPLGVVPDVRTGARRITCTTCYSAGGLEGERAGALAVAAPRAGAAKR